MTDLNEFGPLESAETSHKEELRVLHERLAYLERRERELIREKEEQEKEFGLKRAKLKELFLQKEEELKRERDTTAEALGKNNSLLIDLKKLQSELEDLKAAAAVSEENKQDEVEDIRRQCQEEIASLQSIMKEAADEASRKTAAQYESVWQRMMKMNEKSEQELQDLKMQLNQEREGFLASVAKSLKRVSGSVSSTNASVEAESLEDSMRKASNKMKTLLLPSSPTLKSKPAQANLKTLLTAFRKDGDHKELQAQEDAEILKSVVLPLEEEIKLLKSKVQESDDKIKDLEKQLSDISVDEAMAKVYDTKKSPSLPEFDENIDPDEKIQQLMKYLKAEKSSRTDLEMFVAVLNTQKSVLQTENDTLRTELHEVCRMFEDEKRVHNDLKRTWQMANDQFLESQRLMMMDMRRMESVLTTEQQRQIVELQQKDLERDAQERRVKELEEMREKQQREQEQRRKEILQRQQASPVKTPLMKAPSADPQCKTSTVSSSLIDLTVQQNDIGAGVKKSFSSSDVSDIQGEDFDSSSLLDASLTDTVSNTIRISPEKTITLPSLTEAQRRAITDPTPEAEAHNSLLASVKSRTEGISLEGRRMVSEKEWELLQQELKSAREKLGRPCDMCNNYEAQLQSVQAQLKESQSKIQQLNRYLKSEQQASVNQRKYQEELENNLKEVAEDARKQISTVMTKLQESEKFTMEVKQQLMQSHLELQDQLKTLTESREEIQVELDRLTQENDSLVGKHSKHSQQLQNEDINLPNNLEEMQLLLLKYREEIIAAKVAKEHIEDTLKSEILFLKDRALADQQEKNTLEETLSQEVSTLQERLAILESCKSELERESSVRAETETKLRDSDQSLKKIQTKSKQLINALTQQLDEQTTQRSKLETEVSTMKAKVQSLQVDLENSEAVQRDFVKLSQSLQIQLEKIRQAETEVRWQHEEDVDECNNCRQAFSVTKRKHHCRHCGKIFCADCNAKNVMSGPNMRSSKVCDVCHTILVKDATPYFSTEPPSTPH
ncbi:GTPase-binding effector 1-like isoform X2 [Octopus vulgaris]|uniref:GTPase-binding effector 1-like isoform X2 n=2 Tax=Octopus TaxID=6643 RepID=A0AA36BX09_OCTVU|nr:rab GTPase-binding effector protein 1 isoform X1 [Octopus sinensis]CAI9741392.1 GTPase-binding effector 1-like isoform X2 [Octopus vulgaris]